MPFFLQSTPLVVPRLHNGLGNMLFQIASAYALAHSTGRVPALVESFTGTRGRYPVHRYRSNFFSKLNFLPEDEGTRRALKRATVQRERGFASGEMTESCASGRSIVLEGYFQNEAYFKPQAEHIRDLFAFESPQAWTLPGDGPSCSVHIRRGDYRDLPHIHPILPIDYIARAIERFDHGTRFLIFSDDSAWCRQCLPSVLGDRPHAFLPESIMDYEALTIMSQCDHHIIANSTFSWWGAYLDRNPNKRVVAPRQWFTQSHADSIGYDLTTHPIIPPAWILL